MVKYIACLLMIFTADCLSQVTQSGWQGNDANVLIINSYHSTYQWTENEVKGVISALTKDPKRHPSFYIEYMDTKRFTPGPALYKQFKAFLSEKYAKERFAAIVVTDNNALDFMVIYHQELFPGVPVIACGINGYVDKSLPALFNVIHEEVDIPALLDMALKLFPDTQNVILLCDGTQTSQLDRSAAEAALKEYSELNVRVLDGRRASFQEIAEALKHVKNHSICLFTGFWKDQNGIEVSPGKMIHAAAFYIPVFVCSDAYFKPEIIGGVMTSGVKQGQAAGEAVCRVLEDPPNGKRSADNVAGKARNLRMLNYPTLVRFGVQDNVPGNVVLVGEPTLNFFDQHGRELVSLLVIICLLITLIIVTTQDIFRRLQTAAALKRAEQDLETIFESISDGFIMTDGTGKVERINDAACKLLGQEKNGSIGQDALSIYQTLNPNTHQADAGHFAEMVDRLKSDERSLEERVLISADNQEYIIMESSSLIHNNKGELRGLALIFRDISDEVRQRQDRQHGQKMEAMGKLAGGVAHDFNNLLTSIIGNAELLRMTLEGNQEGVECAEHIVTASSRAADLTAQLLAFSRKDKRAKFSPVNIHNLVDEVVSLLGHSIDMRIEVLKSKAARCHWSMGDASQLQNALLNIAINARDAMPEGGTLTLSTRDVALKEGDLHAFSNQLKPGKYIEIGISDTGKGIDQKLRERIFEPFFTTKDEGKGTGLGLAVVYGIIRTHRGNINLKSVPGLGTTFSILLPACNPPGREIKTPGTLEIQPAQNGHILVVDDDSAIRSLLEKMIKQLGYTVNVCSDGLEAVNFFSRHGSDLDLIIMDLMMPRMGGEEAFKRIRQIDPSAKILLISGYTKNKSIEILMKSGALGFIAKPFHLNEFSKKIRKHMS